MNSINLNALRDRAYKTACDHGFHDEELSNAHLFCLVISELMEAVEADPSFLKKRIGMRLISTELKQLLSIPVLCFS